MGRLAATTGVGWLLAAAVLIYLALIVLLSCTATFSTVSYRRRAAERVLRLLWLCKRRGPDTRDR